MSNIFAGGLMNVFFISLVVSSTYKMVAVLNLSSVPCL